MVTESAVSEKPDATEEAMSAHKPFARRQGANGQTQPLAVQGIIYLGETPDIRIRMRSLS
jgi:hypothetical protein